MGSSKEDLKAFPEDARREIGYQLEHVQEGVDPDDWKPISIVGAGVREIRKRNRRRQVGKIWTWHRRDLSQYR